MLCYRGKGEESEVEIESGMDRMIIKNGIDNANVLIIYYRNKCTRHYFRIRLSSQR